MCVHVCALWDMYWLTFSRMLPTHNVEASRGKILVHIYMSTHCAHNHRQKGRTATPAPSTWRIATIDFSIERIQIERMCTSKQFPLNAMMAGLNCVAMVVTVSCHCFALCQLSSSCQRWHTWNGMLSSLMKQNPKLRISDEKILRETEK